MTTLSRHACTTQRTEPTRATSLRKILARSYGLWSTRRSLAQLTSNQLEDVGVTRAQADKEARRAVWDVPANWRD